MARVQLEKVAKRFGSIEVVHGVDLEIEDGEFMVLVGPSGCGKSTILRMLAGLEGISSGVIRIGDRVVNDVDPKERDVAMVFQNYALYPHMTVRDNMGFSLKMAGMGRPQIEDKVQAAARILELGPFLDRKPAALSGGQRQRVAMGRAIVRDPAVFLFDEPLSNLDAQLRTQMRMELKKLHLNMQTTTVYVTHDQIEAMTLADRIVVLRDGHIMQVGTPIEVFERPSSVFVARFIGNPPTNILKARLVNSGQQVRLAARQLLLPLPDHLELSQGEEVLIGIRPDILIAGEQVRAMPEAWRYQAEVVVAEIVGGQSLLECVVGENTLIAELQGRHKVVPGTTMELAIDMERLLFFDAESEETLIT